MPLYKRVRVVDVWSDFPNVGASKSNLVTDPDPDTGGVDGTVPVKRDRNTQPIIPITEPPPTPIENPNDPAPVDTSLPSDILNNECKLYSEMLLKPNLLRDISIVGNFWGMVPALYDNAAGRLQFTDGFHNGGSPEHPDGNLNMAQAPILDVNKNVLTYTLTEKVSVNLVKIWFSTLTRINSKTWRPSGGNNQCMCSAITVKFYNGQGILQGTVGRTAVPVNGWMSCPQVLLIRFNFDPIPNVKRIYFHFGKYCYGLAELEAFGSAPPTIPPRPDDKWQWVNTPNSAITNKNSNLLFGVVGNHMMLDGTGEDPLGSKGNNPFRDPIVLTDGNETTFYNCSNTNKPVYFRLPNAVDVYEFKAWLGQVDFSPFNGRFRNGFELYDASKQLIYTSPLSWGFPQGCVAEHNPTKGPFTELRCYNESGAPLARGVKFLKILGKDDGGLELVFEFQLF